MSAAQTTRTPVSDLTVRIDEHRVAVSSGAQVCATGVLEQLDTAVRLGLGVASGRLPRGARAALLEAVFAFSELQRSCRIQASMPLGDMELLDGLRAHCTNLEYRAAGATCLVEATVTPTTHPPECPADT